jgi:hypothetical protein
MKTTKKQLIEKAAILAEMIESSKSLEKNIKELKAMFKNEMENEKFLECGQFVITLTEKSRTNLDRESLINELGKETIEPFITATVYEEFKILRK